MTAEEANSEPCQTPERFAKIVNGLSMLDRDWPHKYFFTKHVVKNECQLIQAG